MKNMKYYNGDDLKDTYPIIDNFKVTYYYKNGSAYAKKEYGVITLAPEFKETVDVTTGVVTGLVKEVVFDKEGYETARLTYFKELKKRKNEFKNDCFVDLGIVNDPRKEVLYNRAYDVAHGNGLRCVYEELSELVDFINECDRVLFLEKHNHD